MIIPDIILQAHVKELFLTCEDELVEGVSDELSSALIEAGYLEDQGGEFVHEFFLTNKGIEVGINHVRVIEQAQELLAPFGLDVDKYDWVDERDEENSSWWFNRVVVATLKSDPDYQIMLSKVWIRANGDILQSGSNRGVLTL